MKHVLCIALLMLFVRVSAQSPTENYIKKTVYTAPSTQGITENDTLVSVTYFDGLGRPKQTVNVRAGGQGQDIVTPITYDAFGRQTREYLPYAASTQNGNLHPDPLAELEAFYTVRYPGTTNPYSEKILEASPLGRVMEQGAPGTPWMADPTSDTDHTIKFRYGTNTTDEVRLYKVTTTGNSYAPPLSTFTAVLEEDGFYLPGRLYKTTTKDENWQPGDEELHTTEEFKDFQGRVVLKRTYNAPPLGEPQGAVAHDTYYVYDDYGNLSFVIPPKVDTSDGISPEELSALCYSYVYDHRNRLVAKKLPGKGWESIVYNKGNRPVFTQDQKLLTEGKWLFTKYDKFGRVLYTGLYGSTDSREALQTTLEGHSPIYESKTDVPNLIEGKQVYYTNAAFPHTNLELLTINYYDTYTFDLDGAIEEDAYGVTPTTKTKTLSTGTKVRVLGTDHWITTVTWYDEKARPIYSYTHNPYLNTIDKVKHKVNFIGNILETTTEHTKDEQAPITTIEKFTYDRMGRLLSHTHQITGQAEETLAENSYDALGQLIQKNVGNTPEAPLQTIDYSYNIRGWLTGINDVSTIGNDLFSFDIRYDDPSPGGTPLYNGNISQTGWRTNNTDSSLKNYTYAYDALNRITAAIDNTGHYNLNSISYDKNGNILSLNRQGHLNEATDTFGVMDELTYSYDNGNKLLTVEDTADDTFGFKDDAVNTPDTTPDYTYDDNGNMISDTNKNITGIAYNHLNLPTEITFNDDPNQKINYFYTADGIKQQKLVNDGGVLTTTDYTGGAVYENGSLKFINHTEGYIEPNGAGGYDYVYQYKDHLGNIRLSYSDANNNGVVYSSEIIEESNYYPFGLQHEGYNNVVNGTHHNWDYLNQERHEEFDLNWLSFKWRFADPALGRFFGIDPISEDYLNISPYQFAHNNPVWKIELEGLEGVVSTPNAMDIINEGFSKPNSWQGHLTGFTMGMGNAAKGMYSAVINPIETLSTLATLANPNGGHIERINVGLAVAEDIDKVINGNGIERGEVLGRYTTEALTGKGIGRGLGQLSHFSKVSKLSPGDIRFSQSSVNGLKDLVDSMKKNGWEGNPIDIVEMADGKLTTLDNTRVLAAHEAGIEVQAIIHKADDLLPKKLVERFTTKKGIPKTWGDAAKLRIQKQKAAYRSTYPNGSQVTNGNN